MNIYVSNLGYNFRDEELKNLFASFGAVSSAKVIMDKFTNKSKGFGFVEMSDRAAGEKAIKELNGTMADGRSINVSEARPKDDSRGNSRGGGGGFNKRW
jgi:RNA recognition motif-containing protein